MLLPAAVAVVYLAASLSKERQSIERPNTATAHALAAYAAVRTPPAAPTPTPSPAPAPPPGATPKPAAKETVNQAIQRIEQNHWGPTKPQTPKPATTSQGACGGACGRSRGRVTIFGRR